MTELGHPPTARLLTIDQTPTNKARQSGDLLERYREGRPRNWLTLDRIAVHDEAKVGILPMGVLLSRVGAARADNPPTAEGLAE